MDRTPLVKLLLISALSAGLVVPLFFYSRGLLQKAEQALVATQASAANEATSVAAVTPDSDARVQPQAHSDTGHDSADTTLAQAHGLMIVTFGFGHLAYGIYLRLTERPSAPPIDATPRRRS